MQPDQSTPHPTVMDGFFGNAPSDSSPDTARNSRSSPTSLTPNEGTRDSPPEAYIAKVDNGQIKKRGRKGHSKSRTGCFNCKRARIKVIYALSDVEGYQLMLQHSARKTALRVTTVHIAVFNANGLRYKSTKSGSLYEIRCQRLPFQQILGQRYQSSQCKISDSSNIS